MEVKDFQVSLEYENGIRTEWYCSNDGSKEDHFEPWIYDGSKQVPLSMAYLKSLPEEPMGYKEGEFMKGNSDLTSWKTRYFVVRGGLMTYFKDSVTAKPQGTIPLKDCSIDLPNDGRKSFLMRGRGREADGYEIRITHESRRPFILVFPNSEKRIEWVNFLTKYIAQSFLSREYLLAEKICEVDDGLYVVRKMVPLSGPPPDIMTSDQKKCYLYVDWNSSSPSAWCLRYSSMKLSLSPYEDAETPSVLQNQPASTAIPLTSIRGVELGEYPSSTININIQGKSMYEFNPVIASRSVGQTWCVAIRSALKLQDICCEAERGAPPRTTFRSTSPGRNSSRHISDLKSVLEAPVEPSHAYTRAQFLREKKALYRKTHPNEPESPSKEPSSPLQGRKSILPGSSESGLKRSETKDSVQSTQPSFIQRPSVVNGIQNSFTSPNNRPKLGLSFDEKDESIDRHEPAKDSDESSVEDVDMTRETRTNSTIGRAVVRKIITQRGSSLGMGSTDALDVSNSAASQKMNQQSQQLNPIGSPTVKSMPKRSSLAAISSIISGALGTNPAPAGNVSDVEKRPSILQTRRLSTHRKPSTDSFLSSQNSFDLKEEDREQPSSQSEEIEIIPRKPFQDPRVNLQPTHSFREKKPEFYYGNAEDEDNEDDDELNLDSLRVNRHQSPSEHGSNQTNGQDDASEGEKEEIQNPSEKNVFAPTPVTIQNPPTPQQQSFLQPRNNQFLQSAIDSDSSMPPVRRRGARRHQSKVDSSSIGYSADNSPISRSDTDYSRDSAWKRFNPTIKLPPSSSGGLLSKIIVEHRSLYFLLRVSKTKVSLTRVDYVDPTPTSSSNAILSDPFIFLLNGFSSIFSSDDLTLDCVAAEVDLNGTGLLKLTFVQSDPVVSHDLSMYHSPSSHQRRPFLPPRYMPVIFKCMSGHKDAVEWLKELQRFKLESINSRSTPTKQSQN